MGEKIYKEMKNVGSFGLVLGILLIVSGVVFGILSIVNGSRLLKSKKEVMF